MKFLTAILAMATLATFASETENNPKANISNGIVDAELMTPDAKNGYYVGTRFDWSGVITSLKFGGHEFFSPWQKRHDPKWHDCIHGPVEEFAAVGYDDAKVGGKFLKIGIGALARLDDGDFNFRKPYKVVDGGSRKLETYPDKVVFTHVINDIAGYSYEYVKTVSLAKNTPRLVVAHTLKNTGKKRIDTTVYCHNFFKIDGEDISPATVMKFPFKLTGRAGSGVGEIAVPENVYLKFLRSPKGDERLYLFDIKNNNSVADYNFIVGNTNARAGVKISCDRPMLRAMVWSCKVMGCIEPFIEIKLSPDETFSWTYNFDLLVGDKFDAAK